MSQEDATADQANPGRLRRPPLERSEPRRGWSNLYAPGKADAASQPSAAPEPPPAPTDAATRVIRDGYRIVEENLRRGRQVAAELRGAGREVADFAGRFEAPRVVGQVTQTLFDPALTEQLTGVARSFLNVLGAVMPPAPAPRPEAAGEPRVPLHPQERAGYAESGARVLKMRSVAPGEWLADLEVDGQVRRVQIRAVDGEL